MSSAKDHKTKRITCRKDTTTQMFVALDYIYILYTLYTNSASNRICHRRVTDHSVRYVSHPVKKWYLNSEFDWDHENVLFLKSVLIALLLISFAFSLDEGGMYGQQRPYQDHYSRHGDAPMEAMPSQNPIAQVHHGIINRGNYPLRDDPSTEFSKLTLQHRSKQIHTGT